jgi:hypothetical protein
MAVGPGDPEGLIVVDGVLRHASLPVFRLFGGHWQLMRNHYWGAVGVGWGRGEGEFEGGGDWERKLGGVGSVVGKTRRSGCQLWRMMFSQL